MFGGMCYMLSFQLAKYYCAEDYHSLFGTLCNLCHKYIEGEGLSIQGKGKSYHISCLTCTKLVIGTETYLRKRCICFIFYCFFIMHDIVCNNWTGL